MNLNPNQPSIFTSKDAFNPKQPSPAARNNQPGSPVRRQSNSDLPEHNLPPAAVGEQEADAPLAVPYISHSPPAPTSAPRISAGDEPQSREAPVWASDTERERAVKAGDEAKFYGAGLDGSRTKTPPPPNRTSPLLACGFTPTKRKQSQQFAADDPRSATEPSLKRLKLRHRTKHTLNGLNFGPAAFGPAIEPPSPLFFSHSPKPRPALPPRFSSSEAAARMLSRARNEDSSVKTVSLARGNISTPNSDAPSGPARRSVARSVTDRSKSPEVVAGLAIGDGTSGMLNAIGITELLDQDERPTFVVDLGDSSNYGPGTLQLVFANSSLRSFEGLQGAVSGIASDILSPGTETFLPFKSWLLSAAVHGESLNVSLPPFHFAGLTWSCSTLRKRLRVISGTFETITPAANVTTLAQIPPSAAGVPQITSSDAREPPDYFFSVTDRDMAAHAEESSGALTGLMPTVEFATPGSTGRYSVRSDALSGRSDRPSPAKWTIPPSHNGAVQGSVPGASPPNSNRTIEGDLHTNGILDLTHVSPMSVELPSFDWTRLPITESMPEHIKFARSVDWAATSLGPIEDWSPDLRQMCNLIMASPHPAAMYWGEDLIAIYNEAYVLLAGFKHPRLMGQSYRDAWTEIWDEVKDVFAMAKSTGEATMKDDDCLFMKRSGYLEETYFSWSIIPIVGRDGSVVGLYNPAFEKTRRKIAERRMLTLREVGERTASARDVKAFWAQVLGSFEFNEYDSPLLLLYSVADESDSDSSSIHSSSAYGGRQCILEGTLGVLPGHSAAPEQLDLKSGCEGFGPMFREVIKTGKPSLLEVGSSELVKELLEGVHTRGFGDPLRSVVVCPIHPVSGESVLGFLVLGVNPRRPYDDDYSLFVQLLSRQLATSLASVVLFEEEIRRGQKAAKLAALDRIELSQQLAARTQEAIDSETRFARMAEFAPVGMFIANSDGKITFANDAWYTISGVPKLADMADTWMEAVKPVDQPLLQKFWTDLVVHSMTVSGELRFNTQWKDVNGILGDTWVLFTAYPERDGQERLKSIFGSITNISQQKWAEGIQTRKMEEAVELKRQQENFIDITSHEMRNPLSAILQCADEITQTLNDLRRSGTMELREDTLASCLDAAQTINLCSLHQKRIVDDILTLSKLDSQLLLVTPVDAQPLTVVKRALKMHEGELQAADIQMEFIVDPSFVDLDLDWVRFDPSRVLQVLINLTTNAIKFTGTEQLRTITVTVSASRQRPSELLTAPVKYFPTLKTQRHNISDREWGDGEQVYIHFAVSDTGRGLSPEEKKLLFLRFSQASPRTHVQYGGSGLGLFISRELSELQGGEIGVESEAGKGSTFAFYVAARRSTAPPDLLPDSHSGGLSRVGTRTNKGNSPGPTANSTSSSPAPHTRTPSTGGLIAARSQPAAPQAAAPSSSTTCKVLIVEDNVVNQRVLQKQLKNLGTEVHLANHGGEALEKLKQSTYWRDGDAAAAPGGAARLELGVVLMDQEMPVMDGLTCTRKIRELEREGRLTGHVPIIAVTANARTEQIQTALDAGMDDVVSKPFRIPELMPKIVELLERYPMPRA